MTPAALTIIGLIVQYGLPTALKIIEIVNKPSITAEDIAALKDIKPPEAYLVIH